MTKKKPLGVGLTREERMVVVIGEIIQELLKSHEEKKDVNLNRLKTRIASKYGLETTPRLVDIIAAVPHEAKKFLLPKMKAKPVRTISGVSFAISYEPNNIIEPVFLLIILDCCCRINVQTTSMSSYQLHG